MKQLKKSQSPKQTAPPKQPKGISQEALAQIQANNVQTMLDVAKGWQQMQSQTQKAAAQRFQLAADTSQEIADIYQRIHTNQARSHAKHAKQYVYLLSEVWPEA